MMEKGKNIIVNLIWSLKELYKFKKVYMGFLLLNAILNGIIPVVSLVLIQQITDILQYKTAGINLMITKLLIMTLFQLLCEISLNYIQLVLENLELEFDAYFQARILKKISILDSKNFENTQTYNLINRTQYDCNAGVMGTIKILFSLVSAMISAIFYIVIIIKYNILIFAVITLLPVIRYFFEKKYNLAEYEISIKNTEIERRTSYISFLLTNSENFKEIKSYHLFNFFIKKYEKIKKDYNHDFIMLHNKRTKTYSIISILEKIVDCLVILVILVQTFTGILSIGNFILYNNSIDSLKENIVSILSQISYVYKNSAMVEQIRRFFEIDPEDIHQDGIEIGEIFRVKLKNVFYRYQGNEEYSLKNINLEFAKGDFTVLIGYNGSGKSTLIKIIMGIYNDYEGDIFVNDMNLKIINLVKYRERISVMFQSYIKYESSISDNIKYGNLKTSDNSQIYKMLDKVTLTEFKEYMGQSLGYQFTEGTQISIGQWQKLALGRTLIKSADMYIFDEPNASLDIASEQAVLNMIHDEMQNKIAILIIHRFNCMLEKANKIIVLANGEVQEVGIHEELLKNHGLYNHLCKVQKEMEISDNLELL